MQKYIIGTLTITLASLIAAGFRNPELFDNTGYTGTLTGITGGLIGVLVPSDN